MFLRDYSRIVGAWLDTSEQAKKFIFLFQLLIGATAFLYNAYPAYSNKLKILFIALWLTTLLIFIILLIFSYGYEINMLVYRKDNGILYDKTLKIKNVALRRKTMQIILRSVMRENEDETRMVLLKTGEEVGRDFFRNFCEQRQTKTTPDLCEKELLKIIFKYDSSSGMGKFTLKTFDDRPTISANVEIKNPFTEINGSHEMCSFLIGYLKGVFSSCLSKEMEVDIEEPIVRVGEDTVSRFRVKEKVRG